MYTFLRATYRPIGGLFVCLFLQACAGTPQADNLLGAIPAPFLKPIELTQVPFFPQQAYQCGPAALATILTARGVDITPDQLTPKVYIPQRQGSLQIEIVRTIREYNRIPYVLKPELTHLLAEIKAGRPVLVLQNLGVSWYPRWHYAVVVGYNLQDEVLILRSGEIERYVLDISTFEHTWRRSKHWAVLALAPDELPVNADPWEYLKTIVAFEQVRNWPVLNQAYHTALQQWPDNRGLLMGYGTALYLQHDLSAARDYYERVLIKEAYAPAHNNLAQILAEQGEIPQALYHANKAVELGGVHAEQYQSTLNEVRNLKPK